MVWSLPGGRCPAREWETHTRERNTAVSLHRQLGEHMSGQRHPESRGQCCSPPLKPDTPEGQAAARHTAHRIKPPRPYNEPSRTVMGLSLNLAPLCRLSTILRSSCHTKRKVYSISGLIIHTVLSGFFIIKGRNCSRRASRSGDSHVTRMGARLLSSLAAACDLLFDPCTYIRVQ